MRILIDTNASLLSGICRSRQRHQSVRSRPKTKWGLQRL